MYLSSSVPYKGDLARNSAFLNTPLPHVQIFCGLETRVKGIPTKLSTFIMNSLPNAKTRINGSEGIQVSLGLNFRRAMARVKARARVHLFVGIFSWPDATLKPL